MSILELVEAFDFPPTLPTLDGVGEAGLKGGDTERLLPTAAGEGERRPLLAPAPALASRLIDLKLPTFGRGGKLGPVLALRGILAPLDIPRSARISSRSCAAMAKSSSTTAVSKSSCSVLMSFSITNPVW